MKLPLLRGDEEAGFEYKEVLRRVRRSEPWSTSRLYASDFDANGRGSSSACESASETKLTEERREEPESKRLSLPLAARTSTSWAKAVDGLITESVQRRLCAELKLFRLLEKADFDR